MLTRGLLKSSMASERDSHYAAGAEAIPEGWRSASLQKCRLALFGVYRSAGPPQRPEKNKENNKAPTAQNMHFLDVECVELWSRWDMMEYGISYIFPF